MADQSLRTPFVDQDARIDRDLPADRIFLSNYVREMEIGAYAEERGVVQRVRFDVVLEVARNTAHIDDRAERVVSYDDLVQSIESLIEGPRLNLLETLAEHLAQSCLIDPRSRRVHIRIEKLDRLDGAGLGVEIVRVREPESNEKVWALGQDLGLG
ncbi:MAG: dihydroneopterin aldolase [Pseudomonadota bacterium]